MPDETPQAGRFDDFEQVVEVASTLEALLIRGRLRDSGIEAEVLDQSFELIPLTANVDFELNRVLVPRGQAEEARRVLAATKPLPEDAETTGTTPEVPVAVGTDGPEKG